MPPCRDCGEEWIFPVLEQALFVEKGFKSDPSRCKECRDRRAKRNTKKAESPTNNGRHDAGRQMHTATCADCGETATLPFVPRKDRPVYCSNCFQQHRRTG